jgi:hypothetical protein
MWRPSDATRRRWENKARTRGAEQCWHLKAERDGYSDGLCRTYAHYAPGPSRRLSGPPSSASSPFPHPYRVIGMVIAFVGVAMFDKPRTGATSILQSVVWVSLKRQLRNATLAPCCSYYASCAAVRAGGSCKSSPESENRGHAQPPHTKVSLPIDVGRGLSKSPFTCG